MSSRRSRGWLPLPSSTCATRSRSPALGEGGLDPRGVADDGLVEDGVRLGGGEVVGLELPLVGAVVAERRPRLDELLAAQLGRQVVVLGQRQVAQQPAEGQRRRRDPVRQPRLVEAVGLPPQRGAHPAERAGEVLGLGAVDRRLPRRRDPDVGVLVAGHVADASGGSGRSAAGCAPQGCWTPSASAEQGGRMRRLGVTLIPALDPGPRPPRDRRPRLPPPRRTRRTRGPNPFDDGWSEKVLDADQNFRGLEAVSKKEAWVTGESLTDGGPARVFRTTDRGETWTDVSPDDTAGLSFRDVEVQRQGRPRPGDRSRRGVADLPLDRRRRDLDRVVPQHRRERVLRLHGVLPRRPEGARGQRPGRRQAADPLDQRPRPDLDGAALRRRHARLGRRVRLRGQRRLPGHRRQGGVPHHRRREVAGAPLGRPRPHLDRRRVRHPRGPGRRRLRRRLRLTAPRDRRRRRLRREAGPRGQRRPTPATAARGPAASPSPTSARTSPSSAAGSSPSRPATTAARSAPA